MRDEVKHVRLFFVFMRDEVNARRGEAYVCFHARRGEARTFVFMRDTYVCFHARRGEARTFVFMRDEVKHVRLFSCETR